MEFKVEDLHALLGIRRISQGLRSLGGVCDAKSKILGFGNALDLMLSGLHWFVCVESAVDGNIGMFDEHRFGLLYVMIFVKVAKL